MGAFPLRFSTTRHKGPEAVSSCHLSAQHLFGVCPHPRTCATLRHWVEILRRLTKQDEQWVLIFMSRNDFLFQTRFSEGLRWGAAALPPVLLSLYVHSAGGTVDLKGCGTGAQRGPGVVLNRPLGGRSARVAPCPVCKMGIAGELTLLIPYSPRRGSGWHF